MLKKVPYGSKSIAKTFRNSKFLEQRHSSMVIRKSPTRASVESGTILIYDAKGNIDYWNATYDERLEARYILNTKADVNEELKMPFP